MPEIAHFIAHTGTAMGGPVQSMAAYARLIAGRGCSVTVFASSKKTDGESVTLDPRIKLVQCATPELGPLRYSGALRKKAQAARIDLVHSHGLWTDTHRLAGQITRVRRLPHLLAPCGMLAPGALHHHRWRKLAALVYFQKRVLLDTQCLHAKSLSEYHDFRRFGLRNPVAVIANPVPPPPPPDAAAEQAFRDACRVGSNAKILLFLGRLHPLKGVPRLLHAWSQTAAARDQWRLVLAGPDEGGHRREIESLVGDLHCQDSIVFTGELDGRAKWAALRSADLFVMPSDFENFGNAIVEAMHCGVPVITTTGTPWKQLPEAGAGWCVEPDPDALAAALREAFALSDEQRRQQGRRAADFAGKFQPDQAAADLLAVYEWLLGRNAKPDCVMEN